MSRTRLALWAALALSVAALPARAVPAPAAPASLSFPDGLESAREAWSRGDVAATLERLEGEQSPPGLMLRARARGEQGDHAGALADLDAIPAPHPLRALAVEQSCGVLRRLGRAADAEKRALALQKSRHPGAAYLVADARFALRGCAAAADETRAIRTAPTDGRRHAARRNILGCARSAADRLRVALEMLDDASPLDTVLARDTVLAVARDEAAVKALPRALVQRMVVRLLQERTGDLAWRVTVLRPGPLDSDAARDLIMQAAVLGAAGRADERKAVLEKLHADPAHAANPDAWKAWVGLFSADGPQAAAAWLAMAAALPGTPAEMEARHFAAYHLSESGQAAEALAQWRVVAAAPGPKQRDAGWFVARTLAATGRHLDAAAEAEGHARVSGGNSERASHFSYWAARWRADAGQADRARAAWQDACARWPARLHGRFSCARTGTAPPAAPGAPPETSTAQQVAALLADARLVGPWRARVVAAGWRVAAGANMEARAVLSDAWPPAGSLPRELLVALAELAVSLGDTRAGVVLAERHRAEVDTLVDSRWARLSWPRVAAVEEAARLESADADLALAVARTESFFAPDVRSPAGAMGLMQLMPTTAERLRTAGEAPLAEGGLFEPLANARLGSRYLRMLWGDFAGHPVLVAAAYNAGPSAARRFHARGRGQPLDAFMEAINYRETRGYARRVLEAWVNYRLLRGEAAVPDPAAAVEVALGQTVEF